MNHYRRIRTQILAAESFLHFDKLVIVHVFLERLVAMFRCLGDEKEDLIDIRYGIVIGRQVFFQIIHHQFISRNLLHGPYQQTLDGLVLFGTKLSKLLVFLLGNFQLALRVVIVDDVISIYFHVRYDL